MNRVTYEKFLSFAPCWLCDGRGDELKAIYDQYPDGMTALDILRRADVSADDKLWAVLRPEFIPEMVLHEFACIQAEYALSLVDNPDPRSVAAIETKRRWMRGEATDAELVAARDAARIAAWGAAYDAACVAAYDAARIAAYDAAWRAAREAQAAVLIMMLGVAHRLP